MDAESDGVAGACTGEEGKIEHFSIGPTFREHTYQGTFVVLGATGVGKTTLINFMTKGNTKDMKGHGAGVESKTRECEAKESGRMKVGSRDVEFKFLDSVGFDAADVDNTELFCSIIEHIVRMGDPRIHAIILVHKMDRFRSNFWVDLGSILKMFGLFDIKKENILLTITHSSIYSDDVQETYRKELHDKLKEHVLLENIFHVNFVKTEEVRPQLAPYFKNLAQKEFNKLSKKLVQFNEPFNPQGYFYKKMDLRSNIQKDMGGRSWFCSWWILWIIIPLLLAVSQFAFVS